MTLDQIRSRSHTKSVISISQALGNLDGLLNNIVVTCWHMNQAMWSVGGPSPLSAESCRCTYPGFLEEVLPRLFPCGVACRAKVRHVDER